MRSVRNLNLSTFALLPSNPTEGGVSYESLVVPPRVLRTDGPAIAHCTFNQLVYLSRVAMKDHRLRLRSLL